MLFVEELLSDGLEVRRRSWCGTRAGAELVQVDSVAAEVVLELAVGHRDLPALSNYSDRTRWVSRSSDRANGGAMGHPNSKHILGAAIIFFHHIDGHTRRTRRDLNVICDGRAIQNRRQGSDLRIDRCHCLH